MKKPQISLRQFAEGFDSLCDGADHKTLGVWAKDCAERVLPFFETALPTDARPRTALETLQRWIDTGEFSMTVIRGASLASHAAARDVGVDNPARSAARACGQAVATAHVRAHAPGAAIYALQAIYRHATSDDAEAAVERERAWQRNRLLQLKAEERQA